MWLSTESSWTIVVLCFVESGVSWEKEFGTSVIFVAYWFLWRCCEFFVIGFNGCKYRNYVMYFELWAVGLAVMQARGIPWYPRSNLQHVVCSGGGWFSSDTFVPRPRTIQSRLFCTVIIGLTVGPSPSSGGLRCAPTEWPFSIFSLL